jgi:nitrous oxidase accessory protein
MTIGRTTLKITTLAAAVLVAGGIVAAGAMAATIEVEAAGEPLAQVIARAAPGDILRLKAGAHAGPLTITKPLTIVGEPHGRAVVRGTGTGSVIVVKAPGVTIAHLTITGSGLLLETQDSGIFLSDEATGARVERNRVIDNLIGIYVWGARDAVVRDNRIVGRRDLRMNERGNGVQVWNAPGAVIADNDIRFGRDGIFVTTSKNNQFRGNRMADLRFGVHYMYTNDSVVAGNRSVGNHLGFAIMFSRNIQVTGNRSDGDRDRGILFNYANNVQVSGNVVSGGPDKCVFIYNSNKNVFQGNTFKHCRIGIHFTGGSERNRITGNAFIGNRRQVKYVGTKWIEWSFAGRGNYWSDHTAFDLDGDGIADAAYRPNDLTDQILWRYPAAKLLTNSPAVQVLKWAQKSFPALHPGGVIDSAPLMALPKEDGS